jgi:hypothetical protein
VIYGKEAPELQIRKLGDMYFMLKLYKHAYNCYHTAKKDFQVAVTGREKMFKSNFITTAIINKNVNNTVFSIPKICEYNNDPGSYIS